MSKTLVIALVGALAGGAVVGGATLALAQRDAIAQRQENRNQAGAAMRAIKAVVNAKGATSSAVRHAARLKELEMGFVKLFPASSHRGDTKALPIVWSDIAGFQSASTAAQAAYDRLAVAAGSGDLAALTAA